MEFQQPVITDGRNILRDDGAGPLGVIACGFEKAVVVQSDRPRGRENGEECRRKIVSRQVDRVGHRLTERLWSVMLVGIELFVHRPDLGPSLWKTSASPSSRRIPVLSLSRSWPQLGAPALTLMPAPRKGRQVSGARNLAKRLGFLLKMGAEGRPRRVVAFLTPQLLSQ